LLIYTSNILILVVVRNTPSLDTTTGILMSALAVSDLLMGVQLSMASFSLFYGRWMFGAFLCQVSSVILSTTVYGTMYTLSLMSTDRYILILHPLRYPQLCTKPRIYKVLACIWFITTVMCTVSQLPIIGVVATYNYFVGLCSPQFHSWFAFRASVLTTSLLCIYPCFLVIFFCYFKIIRTVQKQRNCIISAPQGINPVQGNHQVEAKHKGMKTMYLICGSFLICWLPSGVTQTVSIFNIDIFKARFYFIAVYLLIFSSFLNWPIYSLTYVPYKVGQKRLYDKMKNYCQSYTGN